MNKLIRRDRGLRKARRIRCPDNFAGSENEWYGIVSKTRCRCSGPCCGNPRRHYGKKTRQETLSDLDFRQQLEDLLDLPFPTIPVDIYNREQKKEFEHYD